MGETQTSDFRPLDAATIADAFARAVDAAESFAGATAPNPPVGCAILDASGNLLAVEAHPKAGEFHAEARAIAACRAAGSVDRIHTVVVTLEPCNHHGRTPPCSEAILGTPAREVWIAVRDPNPHVAGGGAARLAAAGLSVRFLADLDHPTAPQIAAAANRLIAPFARWSTTRRPFVSVKQALDASGSMIPPPGAKTFTSETSLTLAHRLRRRADAILTGSGTILADRPEFTVRRVVDHPSKQRILAILDRRGRVPDAYLEAAGERGFRPVIFRDIDDALARLGADGVHEVLVEAGPTLTDAILTGGHADEHIVIRKAADGAPDRITILPLNNKKG